MSGSYLAFHKDKANRNPIHERIKDMAAFDTTTFGSHGLVGRIGSTLATLIGSVAAWNDARVTRNALSKLSNRELEDIGLVRGDIDAVAEGRTVY